MIKPELLDLQQEDASTAMLADPTYPAPWTTPAQSYLLALADKWPIAVAALPYAGTAMLAWTRSRTRNCLIRLAPAAEYVRADINHCRPISGPTTGVDLASSCLITGSTDGTQVEVALDDGGIGAGVFSWPFFIAPYYQATATTSAAIIASPSANQDRQIDLTASMLPQDETVSVDYSCAVTFWTGTQSADLSTL